MTQEDTELLLRDLCTRLPYGVIVETSKGSGHICDINLTIFGTEVGVNINHTSRDKFNIEECKPYLFPLSSMTEKQLYEFSQILGKDCDISGGFIEIIDSRRKTFSYQEIDALFQLMNKYHFDYRGLIPKGLAIDATYLNIY